MKKNNKRIIKYFIFANLLILGIISAAVFFLPYEKKIIGSLAVPHNIVRIFIIYISVFLPVSAGTVFFVFDLTEKKQFNPGTVNYFISSLNFIIIPLFAIYSFLILYLNPLLTEKKLWLENLSRTAAYYETEINKYRDKDIEKTYIFSSLYLYIDSDNEKINKIHDNVYIKLLENNGKTAETDKEKSPDFVPQLLTGKKLIEISEGFLKRNDFSSAIYYSELAGKFSGFKTSSKNIVDTAENILKQYVSTDPEAEKLYNGKLEIEDLYNRGNYIDSYYRTVELKKLFPGDSELDSHISRLLEKLKKISFFYEDIEEFIFVPGKENIIFRENADKQTVLINCGKIVFADNNVYLFNINAFIPETGKSWTAPFGKIIDKTLNMNCIGRNKQIFHRPEVKDSREKLLSIPLSYSGEDLINFSGEENSIKKISLLDLASKTEILIKGKFGEKALIIEGAERIIKCINFIIILFISVYSGLSFMKRSRRKNYLTLLLFPAVIFTAASADFFLYHINSEIFENLILDEGKIKTFIIFPLLIVFEFGTSLYLTIKRSNAEN